MCSAEAPPGQSASLACVRSDNESRFIASDVATRAVDFTIYWIGHYQWPIDEGVTAVAIPKLQAHLKTLPGGDAMAKKVEGWGAFRKGGRYDTYYVDRDARKCYRTKPEIVRALKAEASA